MKNYFTRDSRIGAIILSVAIVLAGTSCGGTDNGNASEGAAVSVKTGIEVLRDRNFQELEGKRIGPE